ncbi:MAG: DUF4886 domain-containing protein [Clostridia bacterium]|nr:DUF4886 domain-containing protein [Clostridia bacterium]
MKILSIGNSFSQDAHRWLHKLAQVNDINIETVNLYIGGCSLEMHWNNFLKDSQEYEMQGNDGILIKKTSIKEALEGDKYDIVTLQQVSGLSGIYETYEPYLSSLVSEVKKAQPNAKIYFHQTWAYEIDSNHEAFKNYNHNQKEMYRCIIEVSEKAAQSIGAATIPTGKLVQKIRETIPEFDYNNGGLSLCRDGFHLSLDYGRFAAAAIWLRTLTGEKIKTASFEDFNTELLSKIIKVVNEL